MQEFATFNAESSVKEADQILASSSKECKNFDVEKGKLLAEIERLYSFVDDAGAARHELEGMKRKCFELEEKISASDVAVKNKDETIKELRKKLEEAMNEARKEKERADELKDIANKIHDESQTKIKEMEEKIQKSREHNIEEYKNSDEYVATLAQYYDEGLRDSAKAAKYLYDHVDSELILERAIQQGREENDEANKNGEGHIEGDIARMSVTDITHT